MNVLSALATTLLLASPVALTACVPMDGKAERAFTASEAKPAKLVVESRFLDIDLSVATGSTVEIDAKVELKTSGGNETAEREIEKCTVSVSREGDTLYVRQGKRGEKIDAMSWSGRGSLKVALPKDVPFTIDSASGDIAAKGDFGAVPASFSVASGDISGSLAVASLTSEAASGDTELTFLSPLLSLDCDAASGDIDIQAPSIAKGTFEAASGDIDVRGMAGACKASAASGDVRITFVEFPASAASAVSTASGDITILLPEGAAPAGSISTASGSVNVTVPATKARGSATLTGSGAALSVSAASGSVSVSTAAK